MATTVIDMAILLVMAVALKESYWMIRAAWLLLMMHMAMLPYHQVAMQSK
jgi:hypothetical protein